MDESRKNLPFRKNCEGYFSRQDGHILACITENGIIFPGGGIEKNESIEQGMIRETLEETGAEISNLKFLGLSNFLWDESWAKTEKQKNRFKKFKGDTMYFFKGVIKEINKPLSGDDTWKEVTFFSVKEVISILEKECLYDPSEYKKKQIAILEKIKNE